MLFVFLFFVFNLCSFWTRHHDVLSVNYYELNMRLSTVKSITNSTFFLGILIFVPMDYYLLASTNDVATNSLQIHLKFQFYTVIIRTMVVTG